MNLSEYASFDGLGLAALISRGEISPSELARTARRAIEILDGRLKAVVEIYDDRTIDFDGTGLPGGPFRGVPFLIKDVGGHERGRKIEFGSRLCKGMVAECDTHYFELLRSAGVNVLGRSNTPEYSIAGTAENLLYGNTSTPWREGYSAGGSTGGGAAAVAAGMVPLAHGSDIGGSIRIPASWCGGIGMKPSRGLISAGPLLDEGGFGLAMNFVQTKTMRDTAAMLDCLTIPQPGDPFIVSRPERSYSSFLASPQEPLRIAWTADPLMDAPVDPEIAAATEMVALQLQRLGHEVEEAPLPFDHEEASRAMAYFWFFGFHRRLDAYAKKTKRAIGPETLEAVVLKIYDLARTMDPYRYLDAIDWLNKSRREIGRFFSTYDVLVSPTAAMPPPPHGLLSLNRADLGPIEYMIHGDKPVQYCFPFNVAGAPAISLPIAMHSSGLPIGIQLAARPSQDHVLITLGAALEQAMPWRDRIPPLHVSRV